MRRLSSLTRVSPDIGSALTSLRETVLRSIDQSGTTAVVRPTLVDGVTVMYARATTALTPTVYEPVVCLILQGAKELRLAGRTIGCGPGESVIVSHTVPLASRVTMASADEPYVAVVVRLDLGVLRGLADDVDETDAEGHRAQPASALVVQRADLPLIDALTRLSALSEAPRAEARVMAPLVLREIHYRLLSAEHGGTLRALLSRGSHASRIAQAIATIRQTYREPLTIAGLARDAHMSPSSFHQHFRSVTATTPLRYQKELRLLEARRLLVEESRSVTEAAIEVGYRSPTQFSREYARAFGTTPSEDRTRARAAA